MGETRTYRLGELCRLLGVEYRQGRYAQEEGLFPPDAGPDGGSGRHRRWSAGHAFWIAVAVLLRRNGVRTETARRVAGFVAGALPGVARGLNWDWRFAPFRGRLRTDKRWLVEIGDLEWVRLVTDANPSKEGLDELPWRTVAGEPVAGPAPVPAVTVRLDLSRIASMLLADAGADPSPEDRP